MPILSNDRWDVPTIDRRVCIGGPAQPVLSGHQADPGGSGRLASLQVECQGMESLIPAAPGMTEPLTWETLVAEGRAAGQDPAGLTFPGSRAGLEAVFPVRRRLSPC